DPDCPRLLTNRTGRDLTEQMLSWARKRVAELEKEDLSGFVFKSKSPSCGMRGLRVFDPGGRVVEKGVGLFAGLFNEHFPLLPAEEGDRLHDPELREDFVQRIFVLMRWRNLLEEPKSVGKLVEFHSANKLLILVHSPEHYRRMGRLVAEGKDYEAAELYKLYEHLLLDALSLKATVPKHVNVLQHIMGYFKRDLSLDEKQDLLEIIEQYRRGDIPLIAPRRHLRLFARKYDQPYLERQTYLDPMLIELGESAQDPAGADTQGKG
ncbi:MAG: YbgA family protein, partial [Desulfobacteraceae bacterium]